MKLTFDQIKTITTGCMEFIDDGDGLQLRRFTEEQRTVYTPGHNFHFETLAAAGVNLDFYTDAESLDLRIDGLRDYDNSNRAFDLLIDGCLVDQIDILSLDSGFSGGPVPYGPADLHFRLPKGEKRVTVCMPWDVSVRILSMELEDGAFFRPCEYARTMIAFGDSITHGAFAKYPSMTYIQQTARLLDARLYNFGIGGECFRWKKIVKGSYPKCDLVTVAYGTNDFAHQMAETFDSKLQTFLSQAAAEFPDVPIFVILPLWRRMEAWGETKENGTLQSVRDRIAKEAAKYPNMVVLDGSKWVPHRKEFYGDSTQLHPNDLGMSQYAMGLYKAIRDRI